MRPDPDASLPHLDRCQLRYAERWYASSDHLDANGHYEWMESFIHSQVRLLEIGTGTGQSTATLVRHGHSVISVDENPVCLSAAGEFLHEQRLAVAQAAPRALMLDAPTDLPEAYAVLYGSLDQTPEPGPASALLIEGNVLIDPELKAWLVGLPPRDAVLCWLIGVHEAVHAHAQLGFKNTRQDYYRVRAQNAVYELSDAVLAPGGVLHIVDRAEDDSDEKRQIMLDSHREMTTLGRSLQLESIEFHPYHVPGSPDQIALQNQQGELAADADLFLVSITVRKL